MRSFVYVVAALALAASARASATVPAPVHPLRDECVRVDVDAETRAFRQGEVPFPSEPDFVRPGISYLGETLEPEPEQDDDSKTKEAGRAGKGVLSMTFWLEERRKAIGFLSQVSTRLPHQWEAAVSVDWRDIDSFRLDPLVAKREREANQRARAAAKERPDRLRRIVIPERKSTVGDALQTIADILVVDATVMPKLTQPYGPDWEAVLKLRLEPTDVQRRDGLSVQVLIDHVAQRLKAVAEFRGNSLLFDDEEAAAERRKQDEEFGLFPEELDGDEGAPDLLGPGVEEGEDAEEERAPAQEEDAPAVTPE